MTAMDDTLPRVPGSAPLQNGVWSLVLPGAERLLCRAETPPAFLGELARRGTRIDIVSRCAHESWRESALAGTDGVRCLWEPDADVDYDAAMIWDPVRGDDVRNWLLSLHALRALPRELALWSRNPLQHAGAPHWWRMDGWLDRRGWRPGAAYLGLPEPERVRQLVDWDAYTRTALVRHRRSDQAWKAWMTRRPAWRWMQPARLRRASLHSVTPAPSILESVLADVACASNASPYVERILSSPNGAAIVVLHLLAAGGARRAVLKIPFAATADARVARNAAALEWIGARSAALGRWNATAPRFLARGTSNGWFWTLEEWVEGSDAQSWDPAAKDGATTQLGDYLGHLASLGQPARALDDAGLAVLCGNALGAASALLPRTLAERLQVVRARLYDALRGVPVPLVPRHGDFKLENVLGDAARPETWRVLDWELWTAQGAPLLDAWHLVASRRARDAGCAMGSAVRRWLLAGELNPHEHQLVQRLAQGLDPRYVELSPVLYWLDRIGPIAARGDWPTPAWASTNVAQVLDVLVARTVEVGA